MKPVRLLLPALFAGLLAGCASYVTPGAPADLRTFSEPSLKKAYSARPAARFPASLAIVRVQGSGYRNYSTDAVGTGRYSVVTNRDIETEADGERLARLPGVAGVVRLNRLLLPAELGSDLDLREAAAKLHADIILLYTLGTEFRDRDVLPPLTVVTLGLAPTRTFHVTATAAALVMDVRTGYLYGALEESGDKSGLTVSLTSGGTLEEARKQAERQALDKLLASFEPFWRRVANRR